MQAYITRIKEVNGLINAVVQYRFEAALHEAREIDKRLEHLSQNERKALFGTIIEYLANLHINRLNIVKLTSKSSRKLLRSQSYSWG